MTTEWLQAKISEYSQKPCSDSVAEHLSVYHGALEAMTENVPQVVEVTSYHTPELDGDTEFERIVMEIPADDKHIKEMFMILTDHFESLKIVNNKAYKNVIYRLKEMGE